MKNMLKIGFLFSLAAVFVVGFGFTTEPAYAHNSCPRCIVPPGSSSWVFDGCCQITNGTTSSQIYEVHRNTFSGQRCRGPAYEV